MPDVPQKKSVASAWPIRHSRLAVFFLVVAVLGIALAEVRLQRLSAPLDPSSVSWIVGSTVALVMLVGFAGVFFHRLRVLPLRWRETQNYLAAIQRESDKYRALMEGAADALLVVDPASGRILEWNARAREMLTLPSDPSTGSEIADLLAPEDSNTFRETLRRAGSTHGSVLSQVGIRLRSVDGKTRVADARLATVELAGGRVVHVALRDRTREVEIEHELQIRERLSSIGFLTAGVAHEINNPLEGIGNYLKLLERSDLSTEQRLKYLELVQYGFARIREHVRDLLRFARPEASRGEADLAQVVDRASRLAAFSDKFKSVKLVTEGLSAPVRVQGDAGRLEQVVFNLVLNAANAMQGNGTILVRAELRGTEALLSIADDGPGIPAADLQRIFDPFFTTSGGTGLGLAIVYGIVQAHGGTITARNRPERGAIFTITLPVRPTSSSTLPIA